MTLTVRQRVAADLDIRAIGRVHVSDQGAGITVVPCAAARGQVTGQEERLARAELIVKRLTERGWLVTSNAAGIVRVDRGRTATDLNSE